MQRDQLRWKYVWLLCMGCLAASAAFAQVPVITSINPSSATAGSPGFALLVTGVNFLATAVVQVNGTPRATVFNGPTQLTASILATDIAAPGTLAITIFNPVIGVPGGGFTSGTVALVVTGPPTLTSVTPGVTSPGTAQVRLTLMGTNFKPGATVVISPPLSDVSTSTANVQATDISVDGVIRASDRLLYALVSVSNAATLGLRAVDVVNPGGSNTGTGALIGTSKPLRIAAGNSLGAPLNVTTIAITNPRDGLVISQGDECLPQGALAGTGSGVVIGAWVWDGNITEQFTAVLAGGQSVTVTGGRTLPTSLLGVHTVELRILSPNPLASRPITVVVNPGEFSLERLLAPAWGARVSPEEPPQLRWAPVPGIAKYEVGFSSEPYLPSVKQWYEATTNEWNVPLEVWRLLSDGPIYWTVRSREMTGQWRRPLPMRLLWRFPATALAAPAARPGTSPQGDPVLQWTGIQGQYFYRITVSADRQGLRVLRRYLTARPQLDLRALRGQLRPAETYYWVVEALDPEGRTILTGPVQSFVVAASPSSRRLRPAQAPRLVLASYREVEDSPNPGPTSSPTKEITSIARRSPVPDTITSDPKAPMVAEFSSPPNAFDLSVQVDGTDVTSLAEIAETKLTYTPATPLSDGTHEVVLTLGNDSSAWKFVVKAAAAKPVVSKNDAEGPQRGEGGKGTPKIQSQTQVAMNTQWMSGPAADTNASSVAQQFSFKQGPWTFQFNGSGLVNSVLGPADLQSSHGLASNYIFQGGYQRGAWGFGLRFGMVAPSLYQDSQFVTTAVPRQAVEASFRGPFGNLRFYANTLDAPQGGGFGFGFHQALRGASWDLPLPPKLAALRLMWLSTRDDSPVLTLGTNLLGSTSLSNNVATPGGGDLYGALLRIHLGEKWLWTSEYAWGYNDIDISGGTAHLFGRAWRSVVAGASGPATVTLSFLETSPNFATPANPNLTPGSTPDRRGPSATVVLNTRAGVFSVSETWLESNFNEANLAAQEMNALVESWSKRIHQFTTIVVSAHQTRTTTGDVPPAIEAMPIEQRLAYEADQRDRGAGVTVTRQIGKTMSLTGGILRDWFHNDLLPSASAITTSLTTSAVWVVRPYFQFTANVASNWVSGEKSTMGTTRNLSAYLQPTWSWKHTGLQVQPILSLNHTQTLLGTGLLTNSLLAQQYGGRVSWHMPGELKFSTLTFEGDYADTKNPIAFYQHRAITMFVLWNITWGYKHSL